MSQPHTRADVENRAQRLERVIAALQDRSVFGPPTVGAPPAPLQWAIAEFRLELRRLRRSAVPGEPRTR